MGAFLRTGVDDSGKAVFGGVGELDRLGFIAERLIGEDRSENLTLDDFGVVGLRLDEGRLVPEPILGPSVPTSNDGVAGLPGAVNEVGNPLEVFGMDHR